MTYAASATNVNYLGPASLAGIAGQISRAAGPSGPNEDYVLRLAATPQEISACDEHVFALAKPLGALRRSY